jgi:putative ATP-dependent endonuclease of the OLD family
MFIFADLKETLTVFRSITHIKPYNTSSKNQEKNAKINIMYLKNAHINNFRKIDDTVCTFNCGLNLIVGANDSGKTAVIDALRLVLKQVVDDYVRLQSDDFKDSSKEINIDLTFSFDDSSSKEELVECTSLFAEYLSFGEDDAPELKIWYTAKSDEKGIKFPSFKVGPTKEVAVDMDPYCREKFKVIYLRPLRDAENELRAKQGSRISRILKEHTDIKSNELELKGFLEAFERSSEGFFSTGGNGEKISEEVKRLLGLFDEQAHHSKKEIKFGPTEKIDHVKALERIALYYEGLNKPGLGTLNMIFIAAELLHLNTQKNPNMLLVEEIEAHLHPQRQLKIIRALQDESKKGIQMILTTHSPNLASVVDIERLCAINDAHFYSLSKGSTKLTPENYSYLGRFLSTTKANLFFAQGVILVEGTTEQLLLPEMAKVLGYDLIDYGLSVVSTNGLGFEHFVNIFKRVNAPYNKVPIAVMTDADKRNNAKIETYKATVSDADNKIGCFVGEQLNSALLISKDQGTTFETLILSKTTALKELYLDAYNSKVQRKRALLTGDMSVSFMYSRMKKKKAVLAQEVAQKISDLLNSKDPKIEIIKTEITENLSYVADSIKFVLPPNEEQ